MWLVQQDLLPCWRCMPKQILSEHVLTLTVLVGKSESGKMPGVMLPILSKPKPVVMPCLRRLESQKKTLRRRTEGKSLSCPR